MKHFKTTDKRALVPSLAALLSLPLAALLGILLGATKIGVGDLLSLLSGKTDTPTAQILLFVRIPRVLASLACGAALSVSGAVLQRVLSNRLASPSIVGVNAGAGLAVTICAACGILGGWRLSLFSFLGAATAVLLVGLGAKKWGVSAGTVILMGVALNSLLGAFSDSIVTLVPEAATISSDFRVGSFAAVNYQTLLPATVLILLTMFLLLSLTNELDVLTLGDENARGLGLNATSVRILFLLLAALLAGASVCVCGQLSFVGLLIPYAVRRLSKGTTRRYLCLCALFGASFVSLCDSLSRFLFAPYEISVGILTAFLGAPCFIVILVGTKGGHDNA